MAVQVMALLAFLMENKNVFGPHLIIVPNAVIVNWKSELTQWLPDVRCVYYVGNKEERARKYATEVQSLQFNVLVTTYEFIMRDRAKLSKVGKPAFQFAPSSAAIDRTKNAWLIRKRPSTASALLAACLVTRQVPVQ